MLSIQIRSKINSAITPEQIIKLEQYGPQIQPLLSLIPVDRELHTLAATEYERWLGPSSASDRLFQLLRQEAGLPRVATFKLLARKRPHLLPLRDTVSERALGLQRSKEWWHPWWEALTVDSDLVAELMAIRDDAEATHLSLLRVADIVVWMAASGST